MSCKYSYFDDGIFLCSLRRHKQQCILGKPDLKKCMANGYKKYKKYKEGIKCKNTNKIS